MKRVFLLRHGQSVGNVSAERFGGADILDPVLTTHGYQQASLWADSMADFGIQLAIVSPLRRTCQTACLAFGKTSVPMKLNRHAREVGWTRHENRISSTGKPEVLDELLRKLPRYGELRGVTTEITARLDETSDDNSNWEDWRKSVENLRTDLKNCKEDVVAVVTHGGVIATLVGGPCPGNCELLMCDMSPDGTLKVVQVCKVAGQ